MEALSAAFTSFQTLRRASPVAYE